MYELRTQALIPTRQFVRRWARHGAWAAVGLLASLAIGIAGFHWLAEQSWLDAFVNASMFLGGMGPVSEFRQPAAKVFAAVYALYAGIAFLGAAAMVLAPAVHRVLHKLHLDEQAGRH